MITADELRSKVVGGKVRIKRMEVVKSTAIGSTESETCPARVDLGLLKVSLENVGRRVYGKCGS